MWTLDNIKNTSFEEVEAWKLKNYCQYILNNIDLFRYISDVPDGLLQKVHEYKFDSSYTRTAVSLWFNNSPVLVFHIEYKDDYDNITTYQKTIFNNEIYKEMCLSIEQLALETKWRHCIED